MGNETSSAAADAATAPPPAELSHLSFRIMCVYWKLANRVITPAWLSCRNPWQVRDVVRRCASWEEYVSERKVDWYDDLEEDMVRQIQHMPNLTHLDLSCRADRPRPIPTVSTLLDVWSNTPRLVFLGVARRLLDDDTMVLLVSGFEKLPQLRGLSLRGNPFLGRSSMIPHPEDHDHEHSPAATPECRQSGLAQCLCVTRDLRVLDVGSAGLQPWNLSLLAPAFPALLQLRSLYIDENPLGDTGMRYLSQMLKHTRALTSLDVSDTRMDKAALQALAPALARTKRLTRLYIGSNDLGADGASVLAKCLSSLPHLQALDISYTNFDTTAMRALEPLFCEEPMPMRWLTFLDIGGNHLGPDGMVVLSRCLSCATSLTHLHINSVGLDEPAMRVLEPALSLLTKLQRLDIRNNRLQDGGAALLYGCLTRMPSLTHLWVQRTGVSMHTLSALRNVVPKGCQVNAEPRAGRKAV